LGARAALVALAVLAAAAPSALAESAAHAAPDSAIAPPAPARPLLPVEVHVQFGWLGRGGGTEVRRGKEAYLATGNLLALRRTDGTRTWGLGLRAAGDDDGVRYGLSGVLRGRFAARSHGYWQAAPGVAFAGSDNHRDLRFPAGYFTAEVGDDRWLALCAAVEIVPYRDWRLGYREAPHPMGGTVEEEIVDAAGTELSWYLGGKLQRWPAIAVFLILIVGASASMSNSTM
jgi:hypothetical protein